MSNNPLLKDKVPAKYIGEHSILLSPFGKPYFDAQGKPLESLVLRKGDTLYINEGEARGESWWHDPARVKDSLHLGTGKRVFPEHAGLSEEEYEQLGYSFHGGRPDFEEITPQGKVVVQSVQSADQVTSITEIAEPLLAKDAGYTGGV
jgi:hypothetical protein